MKITNTSILIFILTIVIAFTSKADVKFSGYGSVVAGQTLDDGERFTADFFEVGQYENELTFNAETMIALQLTSNLADNLMMTGQLTTKGSDEFKPEFSWYYLTYFAENDWTVMLGRRNIPMYYYSEFYDVGFAYPWMRPPSNLYWWQIVQFNGLHVSKDFSLGDLSNNVTVYYGNENSEDNKEMGFYAEQGFYDTAENKAIGVNENWRDITGVSWNISGDFFDVRIAYMEHQLDRDFVMDNDTIRVGLRTSQKFYGVGGSLDFNPFTVLFEYNYVRRYDTNQEEWPTFLLSLVYTWNEFQPYIVYSKADQYRVFGKEYEEHTLISYGIRYDFANSASLKVQFDNFNDQGHEPSGWDFHGSSDTLSFGIDFVF